MTRMARTCDAPAPRAASTRASCGSSRRPGFSLQAARDAAGDALRRSLPEPEAGLAAGILIGLRERVDRTLAADFATAGVSHVVAISGWNIAIVAGLVGAVLRGRHRRVVSVAVLGVVVAYVIAAGGSPSVVRAAVMAGVVLLARESGRAGRAAAALGAAAVLLLLVDPALIGDAGFRLSVLATAGLLAWANPIGAWLGGLGGGRMPRWLAESLGISLAAQAATLPDVLATFGRLSLVSPVVNLAVVPLVPVAMVGGVLALAGGGIAAVGAPAVVGTLLGLPGWLVLHVVIALVRIGAAVPFAAVTLPPEASLPVAAACRRRGPRRPRRAAAGFDAGVHDGSVRPYRPRPAGPGRGSRSRPRAGRRSWPGRSLVALGGAAVGDATGRATRITVLDVGQGDAILLETRTGARMLVDGGPDPNRVLVALDERIPPWDRRLDVVVLTHPHEDHVAGLARILERYAVGRVYEPGMRGPGPGWAAWSAVLRDGPPHGVLAAGARLRLGEVSMQVLWPDPGTVPAEPPDTGTAVNNVSVVLLGEANGRRFLLAGDVEEGVDPALLERGLPRVDLLKVAHHGSRTATTQAFLDAVRPRVAVASAGAGNTYGHPAPATLARLRAAGARTLRTDQDGSVTIELAESGLTVRTSGPRRAARWEPVAGAACRRPRPLAHGRLAGRVRVRCARSRSRPARRSPRSSSAGRPDAAPSRPPIPAPATGPCPPDTIVTMTIPDRREAARLLCSLEPPAWFVRHATRRRGRGGLAGARTLDRGHERGSGAGGVGGAAPRRRQAAPAPPFPAPAMATGRRRG